MTNQDEKAPLSKDTDAKLRIFSFDYDEVVGLPKLGWHFPAFIFFGGRTMNPEFIFIDSILYYTVLIYLSPYFVVRDICSIMNQPSIYSPGI